MAPVDLSRPALGQLQAFGLLVAYSVVYVVPLYVSPSTRPTPTRARDDPANIRARIRAVTLSTTACSLATLFLLWWLSPNAKPLQVMGYWPIGLVESAKSLLLTSTLFAGPLYESLIIDGEWRFLAHGLRDVWNSWSSWRNIVAGPVTEECLFRSAAVPLLVLADSSPKRIIFLSPLVFGGAHIHHFYEFRLTRPDVPLVAAIARTVLQLSYTSVFGAYATFLFLRTGSLTAVILVHALCNSLGLPRLWGYTEPYWLPVNTSKATLLKWTIPYYVMLVGGLVLWWRNLYTLTESPAALVQ